MSTWDDQIAHFNTIPWCAKLLSEPGLVIRPLVSRISSPKNRNFEFFAVTINSASTIPFFLAFMRPPSSQVEAAKKRPAPTKDVEKMPLGDRFLTNVSFLVTLGHGLSTFRQGLCHGGMVATILDECNGALAMTNKMFGLMEPKVHVTHSLNVRYLQPVPTGATVMVTTTLVKVEGRRFVVEAEMVDEKGTALARAETIYVVLDRRMDVTEKL